MLDILDPLLRPLARLLVARGVPFPAFAERMKAHYVAAARRNLDRDNAKLTDSRVSAMTGLQRRDVARLRDGLPAPAARPNYLARLVAEWRTNPAFAGRTLPKTGDGSFDTLARQVHQDVHPRTIQDALLAAGTIRVEDNGDMTLVAGSFLPLAGSEDQLDYLARNSGDHLAAACENVSENASHFERAAHYTQLTEAQITELTEVFETEQMALLERISHMASEMKARETGAHRIRVGAYFYNTKDHSE